MMVEITSREDLVRDVACALQSVYGYDHPLINLTAQVVGSWIDPMIAGDDYRWPDYGDKVVMIDTLTSHESFQALEEFADSQPDNIAGKLYRALDGKHPFARFRAAVNYLGILDKWYAFKDKWYEEKADRWLRFAEVDFKDGRIVTKCEPVTWSPEYERTL